MTTAKIHIERMMHRKSIAVLGEQASTYALVKVIPSGQGPGQQKRVGLNLALVLDVSGSMYEEDGTGIPRLKRIQDAAVSALDMLQPDDTMAIIGFAHNASTLLKATPISEKAKIEDIIRKVDMFDVDPGGTAMDEGMALGLEAVSAGAGAGKLTQIVVLTDGETSGEQNCKLLAKKAAEKKIGFTFMGVGQDWKASLIKELADLAKGKWFYIEATSKDSADKIFTEEFETLSAAGFMNVEMNLKLMKDIKLKRIRQVVPEIKEFTLNEVAERQIVAPLGTMQHDSTSKYILDLTIPKRPDGKFVIAQMEITWDFGSPKKETTGPVPLEIEYTSAGHGYVNAEVMKHIDDIKLKDMSDTLQKALASGNTEEVKKVAVEMEKQGDMMGDRAKKKTMLAKQVLNELNVSGRVSKKTQLAMDDAARFVVDELPPE